MFPSEFLDRFSGDLLSGPSGGACVPEIGDYRWEGYDTASLADVIDDLRSGQGAASMTAIGDALTATATALADTETELRTQLGAIGVEWHSHTASDMAKEMLTMSADYSPDAAQSVTVSSNSVDEQSSSYFRVRNGLPDSQTLRDAVNENLSLHEWGAAPSLVGHETDYTTTMRAQREMRQRAVDLLTGYAEDTRRSVRGHRPLPPSPAVAVTAAPAVDAASPVSPPCPGGSAAGAPIVESPAAPFAAEQPPIVAAPDPSESTPAAAGPAPVDVSPPPPEQPHTAPPHHQAPSMPASTAPAAAVPVPIAPTQPASAWSSAEWPSSEQPSLAGNRTVGGTPATAWETPGAQEQSPVRPPAQQDAPAQPASDQRDRTGQPGASHQPVDDRRPEQRRTPQTPAYQQQPNSGPPAAPGRITGAGPLGSGAAQQPTVARGVGGVQVNGAAEAAGLAAATGGVAGANGRGARVVRSGAKSGNLRPVASAPAAESAAADAAERLAPKGKPGASLLEPAAPSGTVDDEHVSAYADERGLFENTDPVAPPVLTTDTVVAEDATVTPAAVRETLRHQEEVARPASPTADSAR